MADDPLFPRLAGWDGLRTIPTVQALLGCSWGGRVTTPTDTSVCDEQAVKIVVVHVEGRAVELRLCPRQLAVVEENTTPRETDDRTWAEKLLDIQRRREGSHTAPLDGFVPGSDNPHPYSEAEKARMDRADDYEQRMDSRLGVVIPVPRVYGDTMTETQRLLRTQRVMAIHANTAYTRFVARNPQFQGADWADCLDRLLDSDAHLELTEPLYDQLQDVTDEQRAFIAPVA